MGRGLFRMHRGQKHQQQHEEHVLFSVNTLDVIDFANSVHIDDLRFKIQRAQEETWNITNDERPTVRRCSKNLNEVLFDKMKDEDEMWTKDGELHTEGRACRKSHGNRGL